MIAHGKRSHSRNGFKASLTLCNSTSPPNLPSARPNKALAQQISHCIFSPRGTTPTSRNPRNMAGESSIIVCKPLVAFSERLKDAKLQHFTVAQLRKKTRNEGLDVSRLTEKWEFFHILVEQRSRGAKTHVEYVTDTKRYNIFDLPGEIRNKIYAYVLTNKDPIFAYYGPSTRSVLPRNSLRSPADYFRLLLGDRKVFISPVVKQLTRMSWANRELRKEVRSFFFANNSFSVGGSEGASFSTFLNDIGDDGRADISELDLDGDGFWMYNGSFYPLLGACVNLRHCKIRMHVGNILEEETYDMIRTYIDLDEKAWVDRGKSVAVSDLVNIFKLLPALQTLEVKPMFPKWDCIVGYVQRLAVAEAKVKAAVLGRLEVVLERKNIKIIVQTSTGGPKLQREMKKI
jgi:hypothetical protein